MRIVILLAALLLLTLAGPAQAQDFAPSFEETECRFEASTAGDVTCGDLIVPEDWDVPDGDTIRLHVARYAARNEAAPEPILFLQGGPGGSGVDLLPQGYPLIFSEFNRDYDFVVLEQRGTRASQPDLLCEELNVLTLAWLDDDIPSDDLLQGQYDALAACRARLTTDEAIALPEYTSANNARDIAALADALDVPAFNLYGVSYGSRLALTVMRDHPDVVRSAVLDAPFPPQVDIYAEFRQNAFGALEAVLAACAADEVCNGAYPDLTTTFEDTYAALNADPITTQGVLPSTGETVDVLINGDAFLGFLFQALYQSALIPEMPRIIQQANVGDVEQIAFFSLLFLDQTLDTSLGMYLSVQCAEEVPYADVAAGLAVEARYAQFARFFAGQLDSARNIAATCALWDVPAAPRLEDDAIQSDIPALVMTGTFDPATPPRWGQTMAETLPHGGFIEVLYAGHGVIDLPCARQMALDFYAAPESLPADACRAERDLTFSLPASGEVVLVPFEEALTGIQGVYPDGWQELAPGTFARSGLGEVAIAQVGAPGLSSDAMLGLITGQLGQDEPLTPSGEHVTPQGEAWTLYELTVQGLAIRIAARQAEGGALLVLLQAPPGEIDALSEQVYLPALDAARFTP